ncbi:unnamed protein product [Paramecium octaurelia]|uniref:Major facilitator superfamily (MFS) profile domain-containing protein n=1 Tax=Paramecium octaurelia TaxID=43137 RepID=A0A8S1X6K6_PAROT|nr:unnamed protein product [Paramecium octaurelia]
MIFIRLLLSIHIYFLNQYKQYLTLYFTIKQINSFMYKSVTLLKYLVANASLGFVYFGYSVGYLNPALQTVDVVFGITENVDYFNGLLSAIMTIGAAIGVLIMPNMLQYFSRRQSLIILDFFGILGYGVQLIGEWKFLVIGRFVAGVVLGLNSALVPVYVNEFSPPELQGVLGSIMTMSGSFGLFLSFTIGLWYKQSPTIDDQYWRVGFSFPLLVCAFRSYNLISNFKLDSPNYYISINDEQNAIESIKVIYQEQYVQDVLKQIKQNQKQNTSSTESYKDLLYGRLFRNLVRISVLACIGQLLGINAVIFYSTQIFNQITNNDVQKSNILNLFIPLLGILGAYLMGFLLNKITRKNFFLLGAVSCVLIEFPLGYMTSLQEQPAILVVIFIFLFILLFSTTIGPAFWVVMPEMVSPKGVCVATSVNWLGTAVVGQFFPMLVSSFSISACFYIFSFAGILGIFYIQYDFTTDPKNIDTQENTELVILNQ